MNARARRIVATAIELAEKGGFEAVRLRDVAADADVALGTLYRYFRSKEDLLIAALAMEVEQLESRLQGRPPVGETPRDRVSAFFKGATKGFCRRPRLARAVLRAAASGDRELAEKVAAFHSRIETMITDAVRDDSSRDGDGAAAGNSDGNKQDTVTLLLENIWFAALVGWAGGLLTQNQVIEQMDTAVGLLVHAAD